MSRLAQVYRQPRPGVLEPARETRSPSDEPSLMLGGHGLFGTAQDYERFCRMILGRGELEGVRVLKAETVDLIFENHLKAAGQKYGLGAAVDGEGGYSWGGADGTQFWIDRKNALIGVFMVQTQGYRAPTYPVFRALANEAAGIAARGAGAAPGPGSGGSAAAFKQRDRNGDGKLERSELPGVLFERLDADKDGFVTEEEASTLWKPR
jgi:CubicO group peptidase (beta-lactamase class C family)